MQKLKGRLQIAIVGFMVAVAAAKLVLQYRSSIDPDPASGRVAPVNLAPRMSDSWDYVTSTDMLIYGALLSAVLLLFLAWAAVRLVDRWREPDAHEQSAELQAAAPPRSPLPLAAQPTRWRRLAFGKRGHPSGQVDRSA